MVMHSRHPKAGQRRLVKIGRGIGAYLTARPNDKRIFDECANIIQKGVRDPSFYIARPITAIAVSFLGLTT